MNPPRELLGEENGAVLVEYGLVCVLVSIVALASLEAIGVKVVQYFSAIIAGFS